MSPEEAPLPQGKGTHTWLVLGKAYRTFANISRRSIASLDLGGVTDFSILEVLLHKGPLPVNTLGRKLFLTSGSMTTAVDRVEKLGWVRRQPHPEDRRVVEVALTSEGRERIQVAFARHREDMDKAFAGMSEAELDLLQALLKRAGKRAAVTGGRE